MVDRVMANKAVRVRFNTEVADAYGNGVLQGLRLVDRKTGAQLAPAVLQGLRLVTGGQVTDACGNGMCSRAAF